MVIILTKRDLSKESKRKPIDKLSTWDDFVHYPAKMPAENIQHAIGTAHTQVFLGNNKRGGYIFTLNNKTGTHGAKPTTEGVIATVIRQLNHEKEIKTDFVQLIREISKSLTSEECAILSQELEKNAFQKA